MRGTTKLGLIFIILTRSVLLVAILQIGVPLRLCFSNKNLQYCKLGGERKIIAWDDKYNSVGISIIDEEHKKLIDIVNKATYIKQHDNNPRAIAEILVEITAYAQEHFKTEETHMIKFKYYDYKSHKDEHDSFSKIISDYWQELANNKFKVIDAILEHLKCWLTDHIQVTDKKYVDCFKENGLK